MSNYFGQLPPQFNNKHVNNNLVNEYQQFANTNIPFNNNSMLMNNPIFFGSIRDANFYNKVNMAKLEQLKKINNVKDFGLSNDKLTNYIICPIKVEKLGKNDLINIYDERQNTYININNKDNIPKILKEWWESRKNTPYKNILKNENYSKDFKSKEDLLVHKVTQLDKDKIRLKNELESLTKLLEKHDGELKIIYSASEETSHKEKFDYINKYKNRIKYDPKNYNELKNFYKKEQKKINKENKRIDEMIELLLTSDQVSKEELEEIQKPTEDIINDNDINDDNMNIIFEKGEHQLEKQLETQLRKELGDNQFEEIINQINETEESQSVKKRIKVKTTKIINDDNIKKIIVGQINEDELAKYKNRKKKE